MRLTIDTAQDPTDTDRAILAAWLGADTARKVSPEPTEATEDAPGHSSTPEPSEAPGDTLESVVAKAQELVRQREGDKVRSALRAVGVKRVSDLTGDQVSAFAQEIR